MKIKCYVRKEYIYEKSVKVLLALILAFGSVLFMGAEAYAENDPILYYMNEPYVEVFFDFAVDNSSQVLEFWAPYPGYYIIQMYGGNSSGYRNVDDFILYDYYNNEIVEDEYWNGYGLGKFINYDLLYCVQRSVRVCQNT